MKNLQNTGSQNKVLFETIPQFAKRGIVSLYSLRLMQKAGTLPGFAAGSRFYIRVDRLLAQLEAD